MTATQLSPPRPARPAGWLWWPITTAAVAWLAPLVLAGMPWWTAVLAGAVVAGAGAALARFQWPIGVYGRQHQLGASVFALVTGAMFSAWLIACGAAGGPVPVARWFVYGLGVMTLWYVVLVIRAPFWRSHVDDRGTVMRRDLPDQAADSPAGGIYHDILTRADVLPSATLVKVETSPSGGVDTLHLVPTRRARGRAMTFAELTGRFGSVVTEVAIALAAARGIDIDDDDVLIGKTSAVRWQVYVTVKRVLAGEKPYPIRAEPRPPGDPSVIGNYENDTPISLTLADDAQGASHVDVLAGTGGGKSVVTNNLIAEDLAADRWEVWVIAPRKLMPLVLPWLKPWLQGEIDRPVIDRVYGESTEECLTGLVEALQFVTMCNQQIGESDVREVAPGRGGLTVVMEECAPLLKHPLKVEFELRGELVQWTASEIFAELTEVSRSGMLKLQRCFQNGLFATGGKAGPEARRNVLAGICGRVTRKSDATGFLPALPAAINPTKLRDNMIYVQPNLDEQVVLRGKCWALYSKLRNGVLDDRIRPVVLAYIGRRNGLDPNLTRHLETYPTRWRADRHPQLAEWVRSKGLTWPAPPATGPASPATSSTTPASPVATPATEPASSASPGPLADPEPGAGLGDLLPRDVVLTVALRILGEQQGAGDEFVDQWRAGTLHPVLQHIAEQVADQLHGHPSTTPTTASATPADTTSTKEDPVSDVLPAGWGPEFDVWAAFEKGPGSVGAPEPRTSTGQEPAPSTQQSAAAGDRPSEQVTDGEAGEQPPRSVLAEADTSGIREAVERHAQQQRYALALAQLPEPLGRILAHMLHPKAQPIVATGWVPTEILAMSLGRIPLDAEKAARAQAVARLGKEIHQATGLTSQEIPRPVLTQLGMDRKSGWRVEELRAAGDRLIQQLQRPSA